MRAISIAWLDSYVCGKRRKWFIFRHAGFRLYYLGIYRFRIAIRLWQLSSEKRCKDCKHIKLLCKGNYRLGDPNWVSPCRDCLQTVDEYYNCDPKDHVHYVRKWWKFWRLK